MTQTLFTHKVIQGFSVVWTTYAVDVNGDPVNLSGVNISNISAEVWAGGNQAVLFNPACTYTTNGSDGAINVTYSSANTSAVPQGFYDIIVSRTDTSTALAFGYLSISPAPGTSLTDLITIPFARAALSDYTLTPTQIEFLPSTITAASNAVKRWCGDRDFIQQDYVEEYDITLYGTVMLNQPPNYIKRIQSSPSTVLTIQNTSASVQEAYVNTNYTGDQTTVTVNPVTGQMVPGPTIVGLNLNRISNGTLTTTAVNFSANETIGTLAAAVTAVGNGWTASVDSGYTAWPVTELIGLQTPGDAIQGATYDVYTKELGNDASLDPTMTGLLRVGRQYRGLGPKWGPSWLEFDNPGRSTGRVKVTYNAGFATVPMIVQKCVASVAKNILTVLALDHSLKSEQAEEYSYTTRDEVELLPSQDRQALAFYRIHHA